MLKKQISRRTLLQFILVCALIIQIPGANASISTDDARRLGLQHHLDYNVPLAYATFIGTHNSFNSSAYKSAGISRYPLPQQKETMTTQLNKGARALSLDVHYINGKYRLCHSQGNTFCGATDLPFKDGLIEIYNWLNANPDEVLLIDIQDELTSASERAGTLAEIKEILNFGSAKVYRPLDANPGNGQQCQFLPMQELKKKDLINAGRRVLISTSLPPECDNSGTEWRDWLWATPAKGIQADPFTEVARFPHEWSIVYEDRVLGVGDGAHLSGSEITTALEKGAAMLGLDFFVDIDRHSEAIWSWASNEPNNSGNEDCATLVHSSGKWNDISCSTATDYHYACQDTRDGSWSLSTTKGGWPSGTDPCTSGLGADYIFAAPVNATLNADLKAVLSNAHAGDSTINTIWLNASDSVKEDFWVVNKSVPRKVPLIPTIMEVEYNPNQLFHLFRIPENTPHNRISLLEMWGAAGGYAKMTCTTALCANETSWTAGGGGGAALINVVFEIGNAPGQIKPGSEIGVVIGGAGQSSFSYNFDSQTAGGGGGGTAVFAFPPGSDAWQILAVAGGGGGAYNRLELKSDCLLCVPYIVSKKSAGGSGVIFGGSPAGGNVSKGGGGGGVKTAGGGWDPCPTSELGGGTAGLRTGGQGGSAGFFLCPPISDGGYGYGGGGSGARSVLDFVSGSGGGGGGGWFGGAGGSHGSGGNFGGSYINPVRLSVETWGTKGESDPRNGVLALQLSTSNTAPVARSNSYTRNEDTQLIGNVISDDTGSGVDSDEDSDVLTAVKDTNPGNGSLTLNTDGSFTYTPNLNYCGPDSFTYHANDGTADSNIATVTINVTCVDDPPVAVPDSATVTEDDPATAINVLFNDTDIDAGPKGIVSVTQPSNGTVVITNAGADLTYQPAGNYCNDGITTDDFTYTLTPGGSFAAVRVTVSCVDDPPVAVDDTLTVTEDDSLTTKDVLFNDTDIDGGPKSIASFTQPANGLVQANGADLDYRPNANYCNNGNAGVSTDDFTYTLTPGGSTATVAVTVTCVNDAPVANDDAYDATEDTLLSIDAATGVLFNDTDVDGDVLSVLGGSVSGPSHGTLEVASDGSFTYQGNLNYCGPDSFSYKATDAPPIDGTALDSGDPAATVSITVACVNDPPTVTSVLPGAQTSDYSDYIGTVVISVNDVDNVSTTLEESNEPPLSDAGLSLTSTGCSVINTESPNEDGSDCTWSYDGQVVDPGDNVYAILFTASDAEGAGSVTGTHTLTIVPEEATVVLDPGNDIALQVAEDGGNSGPFLLHFTAVETTPDLANIGSPEFGNLNEMLPIMNLVPVGPGGPIAGACSFIAPLPDYPGEGYDQVAYFECAFDEVPVNTYEVIAQVDGASDTTRYYTGEDDAVLVIFDPSLGFTTGGGWFYWPGTADPELLACGEDGYAGDKTNFGFNMKYNKKRTNIQGSLLLQRHTVDANCEAAGKFRVKSNALDGLSIGDGTDADGGYGWAAFSGKSVFSEPGLDGDGNHPFLVYVEDHTDEGGNQDPVDEFWIQVKDKDGIVVLETNGPDSDPAGDDEATDGDDVSIENGNIIVPHSNKGGGKP